MSVAESFLMMVIAVGLALTAFGGLWLFGHVTHDITLLLDQANITNERLDNLEGHAAVHAARLRGVAMAVDADREAREQRIAAHRAKKADKAH